MDTQPDVTPEAESSPAPAEAPPQGDRPLQNTLAEFNRKFGAIHEQNAALKAQNEAIMAWIANQQQAAAAPQRRQEPASGETTDEQLWQAAQQGDRGAFEEYQRRIARRELGQATIAQNGARMVQTQIATLTNAYPQFNDGSHPLAQAANAAYQVLLAAGAPAHPATVLDAMKTAIADRPDIISELHGSRAATREGARRTAAQTAQSGVFSASHRQGTTATAGKPAPLSRDALAIARRMGVKDPAGSMERFRKRRDEGVSNIGAVGSHIEEEY